MDNNQQLGRHSRQQTYPHNNDQDQSYNGISGSSNCFDHSLQTFPSEVIVLEETISTNKDSSLDYLDENASLPQAPMLVEMVNCEDVQIGSTINFHGPTIVTENSWKNIELPSMSARTEVSVYDGSEVQMGPSVSYKGLVNVTSIVKANTVKFDETERLTFEDQLEPLENVTDGESTITTTVNLINRSMWHALPPVKVSETLQHPVPYVVISHTATEECLTLEECVPLNRQMQNYHMVWKHWDDIAYSFLIGGDGNIYEGRGWDTVGCFAKGYNRVAIGIAVIGTFIEVLPSKRQLRALEFCIEEGVRLGKISKDYKVLTHQQLTGALSPGAKFIELIKTWPCWSATPNTEEPL